MTSTAKDPALGIAVVTAAVVTGTTSLTAALCKPDYLLIDVK